MKIVRRVFVSGALLVVGVGGCASFGNEAQNRRVLGVIVDQLVLVDGAAGKGVSVGVGAAGGRVEAACSGLVSAWISGRCLEAVSGGSRPSTACDSTTDGWCRCATLEKHSKMVVVLR